MTSIRITRPRSLRGSDSIWPAYRRFVLGWVAFPGSRAYDDLEDLRRSAFTG